MTKRTEPRLFRGGLSGRVFVATRWHFEPSGVMVADEKFDVTDQFVAVAHEFDDDWWNAQSEALP